MQTDIILTGTGYPRPHALRAGPDMLVRRGATVLQFDAGRGTAMRLAALDISCRDLNAVFISHHHSDHMVAFGRAFSGLIIATVYLSFDEVQLRRSVF